MFGNMSRLGSSHRTAGAVMVGAGGSRPGAGSLSRVYNWCQGHSTDALACTLGTRGGASLVSWVASSGYLLYGSTDGTAWELCKTQPFTMGFVVSIAYRNNIWVASCINKTITPENVSLDHSLAYSYDGLHWYPVSQDPFAGTKLLFIGCFAIVFAEGLFVAVGASPSGTTVAYSFDGVYWKPSPDDPASQVIGGGGDSTLNYGFSLVYNSGTWLFSFISLVNGGTFYTSYTSHPSSGNWSTILSQPNVTGVPVLSAYPGKSSWFAFGNGNFHFQTNHPYIIFEPITDFYVSIGSSSNIAEGTLGEMTNTLVCALENNSNIDLYTSSEGADGTWTKSPFSILTDNITCLLYADNVWVAGGHGLFYSTDDGNTWVQVNTDNIVNIGYNGTQWQAYSYYSFYYSAQGVSWKKSESILSDYILTLQSNVPGTIVAVTYSLK